MHCTLKGKGGEEEDPPDVLWLRDGVPLQFADTNQFQVHTGSNSWTVISTLRYAAAFSATHASCFSHVSWGLMKKVNLLWGSHTWLKNVCSLYLFPVPPPHPFTWLNQYCCWITSATVEHKAKSERNDINQVKPHVAFQLCLMYLILLWLDGKIWKKSYQSLWIFLPTSACLL